MPDIGDLFARSWELYKRRVLTLFAIPIVVLVPFVVIAYLLASTAGAYSRSFETIIILLLFFVGSFSFMMIFGAAISAIADESLTIWETLMSGAKKALSLGWIFILTGFIFFGGFMLFFIFGFIFSIWFFFAPFILFNEGDRGMNALLKSKAYIKGYFWQVFLRLLVISIVPNIIGLVPILGAIVLLLFFPFIYIFMFLTYEDLRSLKGDITFSSSIGEKAKWLSLGALGHILLPVIIVAFMWSYLLVHMSKLDAILSGRIPMPMPQQKSLASGSPDRVPAEIPIPLKLSEYDNILSSQKIDFDSGPKVSVGPAALLLDDFWEGELPRIEVKVRVVSLPNLDFDCRPFVRVVIDHIWDRNNDDIYGSDRGLELDEAVDGKRDITLSYWEGKRYVALKAGAKEGEIARVQGTLVVILPETVDEHTFDSRQVGGEQIFSGGKVTIKDFKTNSVSFDFDGNHNNLINVLAFDRNGNLLRKQQYRFRNRGRSVSQFFYGFDGEVASVKILVAPQLVERRYPFELKR